MEQVELPSNLIELSRDELVSWSLRINPAWGINRGNWSRQKLIDRLRAWQSHGRLRAAQAFVSEQKQILGELMKKTSRELVAEVKALSGGPVSNRSKAETAAQLLQLQRGRQMLSHALDAGAASSGVRIGDAPSVNAGPGKALRKPSLKTKPSARSRPSRKSRPSRLKKKKPLLKTKPSQDELVCKEKASFD